MTDDLIARLKELEAALRPFAKFSEGFGRYARDDSWVITKDQPGGSALTMGDVRAAEDALGRNALPAIISRLEEAERMREALEKIADKDAIYGEMPGIARAALSLTAEGTGVAPVPAGKTIDAETDEAIAAIKEMIKP